MITSEEKGWGDVGEGKMASKMVMEGELTLGGEHTIQCCIIQLYT